MAQQLQVSIGQCSDKGRKPVNQDFHGACLPSGSPLANKGVAVAIADGISSSAVSDMAAQSAVRSLLEDYYCTSEAWSVKTSVERVVTAANSWLYAQTQQGQGRYDKDRGCVCTLSALVVKSATAHIFHVGDCRIHRVQGRALEPLTQDHRVRISSQQSYLGRALGIGAHVEIDYRSLSVEAGDVFILSTDGVHEHVPAEFMLDMIARHGDELDVAARRIVEEAFNRGSPDNLTLQIVRIDALPGPQALDIQQQAAELSPPPLPEPRTLLDGYRIVREIHGSHRSHIYLAMDEASGETVALKIPSIDLQGDPAYRERFLMEEWIARRIRSAHVLKPCAPGRPRRHLYTAMEYVEGRTLAQWMIDHPKPDLDTVRGIVSQVSKGLRTFHRLEMLHQDLRPQNVLIDATGTVKIIDFGSVRVAGLAEGATDARQDILGTAQYAAPEYFVGEDGTPRSDLFSLAVITYQMLCGQLPYGLEVAKTRSRAQQRKLQYTPLSETRRDLPAWIDEALRKALQAEPEKRQADLAEFVHDLHHPSPEFVRKRRPPLIERHPVVFWKGVSLVLSAALVAVLGLQGLGR